MKASIRAFGVNFIVYGIWKYRLDHVAFWLITLGFYAFTRRQLIATSGWNIFVADVIVHNLLIAAACYTNIYYLFERFFKAGKYLLYALSLATLLIVYTILQNASAYMISIDAKQIPGSGFLYHSYYHFSIGLFYIAFTLALELSKRWYKQELLLHKVQTEKLHTELQYLKAQLNPHFLFNCINTIYFQIDENNSEARESLRKFADLLRYQLYECNEDEIPIEKETEYLESYVDLQRLRKDNNNQIVFHKDESVSGFKIAPLLLLPFVENAFKHLSHDEANNFIDLNLNRTDGKLIFSVTNSSNGNETPNDRGIGLKNAKRRLDLLYENKYRLNINKAEDHFNVMLELDL